MILQMKFDDIPFFDYSALTTCYIISGIANTINQLKVP